MSITSFLAKAVEAKALQPENFTKLEGKSLTIDRKIICRNEGLEGQEHPITGVKFERKIIEYDGERIEGTFPEFESKCDVQLPEELYEASNKQQFDYANNELKNRVESEPELASQFDEEQLEQISNGDKPDGCTWHHSEEPGKLELVDTEIHDKTGHTGGQVIWALRI